MNRLKQLGIRDDSSDVSGMFKISTHVSVLGAITYLDASIQLFLAKPGKLFCLGQQGVFVTCEEIKRSEILSVRAETGLPVGVGREERSAAGLPVSGEYPYLVVTLNEVAEDIIKDITEISEALFFAFDYDFLSDKNVKFLAVPGEKENSYYLISGRCATILLY